MTNKERARQIRINYLLYFHPSWERKDAEQWIDEQEMKNDKKTGD